MERADWATRTIQKELEALDRFKRVLEPASALSIGPNARAMQLLTAQNPSVKLQEHMEAFSKRIEAFTRQPRHLVDQMGQFEKLVSSHIFQPLKQLDALRAATEAHSSWNRYSAIAASLEKLQQQVAIPAALSQLVDKLDQAARAAEAAGAGQESFDGLELEQREQAAATLEALVHEAERAPDAYAQVDRLFEAIKSTQDTKLQRLLWSILVPVLIGLVMAMVTPVSDFYVKKWLEGSSSRQESTKVIKQEARRAVDDVRLISDYRFVDIAKEKPLVVRTKPSAKAPRVGELRFSQVVYVVETTSKKDFTLVEWRSDDGTASLKGWVFSRYLKKFG